MFNHELYEFHELAAPLIVKNIRALNSQEQFVKFVKFVVKRT